MGSLIVTLFVGLIVGALARFVMPGEQKLGWILTSLLGVDTRQIGQGYVNFHFWESSGG